MKKLFFIFIILSVSSVFASDKYSKLVNSLYFYRTLLNDISTNSQKINLNKVNSLLSGRQAPYAMLYEHTGLYEWQLFHKCYYEYDIDTTGSVVDVDVEYRPNDEYFSTIPAFFSLYTKRPYSSLEDYKTYMITLFKSLGTNISVLNNEKNTKYGYPGFHYCQSFTFSTTRMVIDCYFIYIDNIACAVYYMTGESFYGNFFYQIFFDLILDVLEFHNSSEVFSKKVNKSLDFDLIQNYPNPFNSNTRINYYVDVPSIIKLDVYNCNGKKIKTLFNHYHKQGQYSFTFDASGLASGVYIYRLTNNRDYKVHRMTLIK